MMPRPEPMTVEAALDIAEAFAAQFPAARPQHSRQFRRADKPRPARTEDRVPAARAHYLYGPGAPPVAYLTVEGAQTFFASMPAGWELCPRWDIDPDDDAISPLLEVAGRLRAAGALSPEGEDLVRLAVQIAMRRPEIVQIAPSVADAMLDLRERVYARLAWQEKLLPALLEANAQMYVLWICYRHLRDPWGIGTARLAGLVEKAVLEYAGAPVFFVVTKEGP